MLESATSTAAAAAQGAAPPARGLQRHHLVWLDAPAWRQVLARADDALHRDEQAADCLAHWAANDLPLVVTQQPAGWRGRDRGESIALGLAAPAAWGRRRLFVAAPLQGIRRSGAFPSAAAIAPILPAGARDAWSALCMGLDALGVAARVYGSHGWQILTGLDHLHADSDIDLLLPAHSPQQADAVVARLSRPDPELPRIDGEIVRADGMAIAWREWAAWRGGRTRQLLVKRLGGAALVAGDEVWPG